MLKVEIDKHVARVILDRPDVHNAFNDESDQAGNGRLQSTLGNVKTSASLFSLAMENHFARGPTSIG